MASLILSDEQVIELVKQLPVGKQTEVFQYGKRKAQATPTVNK
jgi:hypothetical protein